MVNRYDSSQIIPVFLRIFVCMKIKTILLSAGLLSSLFLLAQPAAINQTDKNGKKQGKWAKKDKYDRVLYEGNFKDGNPIGEFRYYYDNKDLKTHSVYSEKGTVCRTKHYFPGSILMAEGKYVNEKRDSVWKFYNAPNALVSEESFSNGKKDGFEKNYNGKGKLVEERNWKDSVLHGPWKKYYEDGSVQQVGLYKHGFLEGEMKFFYPGNVLAVVGVYQHSLKHGRWTTYNRSGKIITLIENYNKGTLHGYYAEWSDKDGAPKVKGNYKQGQRHEKWSYFAESGKLEKDTTFFMGYLHGPCSEYFVAGTKKTSSHYYFSHKTGTWLEWDETGKVLKEEKFESIEEVKRKMPAEAKNKKKRKVQE